MVKYVIGTYCQIRHKENCYGLFAKDGAGHYHYKKIVSIILMADNQKSKLV